MARKSRKQKQNISSNTKPKRYNAGIYVRVSSEVQTGDSTQNQEEICREYIELNDETAIYKVYTDNGFSSFAHFRPGFDEMISDIEAKKINLVITKDISRLTRDFLIATELIQKTFPKKEIRFISVNDDYDSLHSDATKLDVALRSLLYHQYSLDLSDKIQSVIRARQKSGKYIPPRLPYGYKKVRSNHDVKWKLDSGTSLVIQKIFENALNKRSAYSIIASDLNRQGVPAPSSDYWTSSGVLRILRNISYTGTFITHKTRNNKEAQFKTESVPEYRQIKLHNHHTPIIDNESFNAVQQILSERTFPVPNNKKIEDFFYGKIYCGICGRKMRLKRSSNRNISYVCPRRDEAASSCSNKAKSMVKLKNQVFLAFVSQLEKINENYLGILEYECSAYFERKTFEQDNKLAEYQSELTRLQQLWVTAYEDSFDKNYINKIDDSELLKYLSKVHLMLSEQIAEIEQNRMKYQEAKASIFEKYERLVKYQNCTKLTCEMVLDIIERVYVGLDRVNVDFKLKIIY